MKKFFLCILLSLFLFSCGDDPMTNTVAQDLQGIISSNRIIRVQACLDGGGCTSSTADFSFPGDNIIRIEDEYFNLTRLIGFLILEGSDGSEELLLTIGR